MLLLLLQAGKYAETSGSSCTNCFEGSINPLEGKILADCKLCDANSYSNELNTKCVCHPGYAANDSSVTDANPVPVCEECEKVYGMGALCNLKGEGAVAKDLTTNAVFKL